MEAPKEEAFVVLTVLFFCPSQSVWSVKIFIDLINLRLKFGDHVPSLINSLTAVTYGAGEDPVSH